MTTYAQACLNGHVLNISTNPEYIAGDYQYCPECGTQGITGCQNCHDQDVIISEEVLPQDAEVARSDLDLFCRSCGSAYPWAGDEDGYPTRNVEFVSGEVAEQEMYRQLISEINRCYRVGAYNATTVLVRKVAENALIDVFHYGYGTDQLELYYDTERQQHKGLSELISNFNSNIGDFKGYHTALNESFIDELQNLRDTGNAGAHSIINQYSEEKMSNFSNRAGYVLTNLLQLKERVRTDSSGS